ncbi:hypothetical protein [Streptomyces sp. HO565]|uniref:hypothetical protein n=1 Tax=Streptomyces sp. HO565 TaxID=2857489 RepID=UPI0034DBDF43
MPYDRDETIRAVLRAHGKRVRVGHVPLPVAHTVAGAAQRLGRLLGRGESPLTRYAVDQLASSVVLGVGTAASQGWTAVRTLADCTTAVPNT